MTDKHTKTVDELFQSKSTELMKGSWCIDKKKIKLRRRNNCLPILWVFNVLSIIAMQHHTAAATWWYLLKWFRNWQSHKIIQDALFHPFQYITSRESYLAIEWVRSVGQWGFQLCAIWRIGRNYVNCAALSVLGFSGTPPKGPIPTLNRHSTKSQLHCQVP